MPEAEDKEKAEKVAAAKKRYEQLKKQKAKKGGTASKKKEDNKPEAEASTTAEKATEDIADEAADTPAATVDAPEPIADPEAEDEVPAPTSAKPTHGRKPSVAVESRLRSASFRQPLSAGLGPASPTSPGAGGDAVGDIYRKQAQRIEELEKENKRLAREAGEAEKRWRKTEEDLEELREGSGDVAELKGKADLAKKREEEIERLKIEVSSLQRQLSHAQTATTKTSRRISTSSPDLTAQLQSKSTTIESLELEVSNLHAQLTNSTTKASSLESTITSLETAVLKAEQEANASRTELSDLKSNLDKASEKAQKEGSERSDAETRIAQLGAESSAASRRARDAVERAELLEKKVGTLTTLHRESDARNQVRQREQQKVEREAAELKTRVTGLSNENARLREAEQRRRKAEVSGDDAVQELVDEERERLEAKVRDLEEEVFELRRGVWRDRRREMQPAIDDAASPSNGFDDVDLSGGYHTSRSPPRASARGGSSFQDVINSGISAFTGQQHPRRSSSTAKQQPLNPPRKQSLASLGSLDDFEFDEDAFRAAQEEEMKRRIERVREVKRGLKNWEGWRTDWVDVRAGLGGVFEV